MHTHEVAENNNAHLGATSGRQSDNTHLTASSGLDHETVSAGSSGERRMSDYNTLEKDFSRKDGQYSNQFLPAVH
jgi:hypothetical protein